MGDGPKTIVLKTEEKEESCEFSLNEALRDTNLNIAELEVLCGGRRKAEFVKEKKWPLMRRTSRKVYETEGPPSEMLE